jgi:hypothetical protein
MHNWKQRKQHRRKTKNGEPTGLDIRRRAFDIHGPDVRFDNKDYKYVRPGSNKK